MHGRQYPILFSDPECEFKSVISDPSCEFKSVTAISQNKILSTKLCFFWRKVEHFANDLKTETSIKSFKDKLATHQLSVL